MELSISNIAWDVSEDVKIAALLDENDVRLIDVAPTKYFPDLAQATEAQVLAVKHWWKDRGIEIYGMQSLLFGTNGLNMFASSEVCERMLAHLAQVARVASGLGVQRLVFGSPRNRDRRALSDEACDARAVSFFRALGAVGADHGVTFCLEPNPERYNSNFMTHSQDTARIVRLVDHPHIRMQLDTGAILINAESPVNVLTLHGELIGHVHLSEPGLATLGSVGSDHSTIAAELAALRPDDVYAIEMLPTGEGSQVKAVSEAIRFATATYRQAAQQVVS
ncbi:sugar phosphate isomerase/epimerase family protein [Pseudomonas sp. UBA4194]|uniref:sugar phosphate isomerase/epimerase family protein n=1 Tax=Pseudomonas sp. UBA4194 TaxID=1947317 RepID=UPI0025D37B07|nr:TIM barrel protein [Pseudomonas sp. UBA4194]